MRTVLLSWCLMGAAAIVCVPVVNADESDGCSHFSWDVSHELAVMKQTAKPVTAATQRGTGIPRLEVDKLYDLKLAPQSGVKYIVTPAKPTLNDSTQGGLARFRVSKDGLYRVSLTSGHWIDVVDGEQLIKSKDFQGSRGCARPHKIVEFVLPANKDLVLQLSGAVESPVTLTITPAPPQ
jgi:hypothetical protein